MPHFGEYIGIGARETHIPPSYLIFIEDATIKARNGATGIIDFEDADAALVMQAAMDAIPVGGRVYIMDGYYHLSAGLSMNKPMRFGGSYAGNTVLDLDDGVAPPTLTLNISYGWAWEGCIPVIEKICLLGNDQATAAVLEDAKHTNDLYMENVLIGKHASHGIKLDRIHDFHGVHVIVESTEGVGVWLQPDEVEDWAWDRDNITLIAPYIGDNTLGGLAFTGGTAGQSDCQVLGGSIFKNGKYGVWYTTRQMGAVMGVNVFHNNEAAAGNSGIEVDSEHVRLIGNHVWGDTHQHCIHLRNTSDYVSVLGNVLGASIGSKIQVDAGGNVNGVIKHNPGYVTENKGRQSITGAVNAVNVAHGLAGTPDLVLINPEQDSGNVWVTAKGAANFTINFDQQPGAATWYFQWYAEV